MKQWSVAGGQWAVKAEDLMIYACAVVSAAIAWQKATDFMAEVHKITTRGFPKGTGHWPPTTDHRL